MLLLWFGCLFGCFERLVDSGLGLCGGNHRVGGSVLECPLRGNYAWQGWSGDCIPFIESDVLVGGSFLDCYLRGNYAWQGWSGDCIPFIESD